jgi:hypothetical protein
MDRAIAQYTRIFRGCEVRSLEAAVQTMKANGVRVVNEKPYPGLPYTMQARTPAPQYENDQLIYARLLRGGWRVGDDIPVGRRCLSVSYLRDRQLWTSLS